MRKEYKMASVHCVEAEEKNIVFLEAETEANQPAGDVE